MEAAQKIALIVDDSATARIMLARVLTSMEIQSRQAKSGEEALKSLTQEQPDLIFLDHLMPGMDGFQTLRAIKSSPDTRSIPVIMYTSQNAPRYQEEARTLGAAGVITKQVDREQLYLMVERAFMQDELSTARQLHDIPEPANDQLNPSPAAPPANAASLPVSPEVPAGPEAEGERPKPVYDIPELETTEDQLRQRIDRHRWYWVAALILVVTLWLDQRSTVDQIDTLRDGVIATEAERSRERDALNARIQTLESELSDLRRRQQESRQVMGEMISIIQENN